jgi:hypothetical protein
MASFEKGYVGQTIASQIGINNLLALGAYGSLVTFDGDDKTNDGGLMFIAQNNPKMAEAVKVIISLDFNDTYSIKIGTLGAKSKDEEKELFSFDNIYCDQLEEILFDTLG